MANQKNFTPALGRAELTADYDRVIGVMTRETKWRGRLVGSIAPQIGETVVDLGCGTGTLAIMLASAAPNVRVIGVDPDPDVLTLATEKALGQQIDIEFFEALGGERIEGLPYGNADKVLASLVLHHCPIDAKQALLANAYALLKTGGALFIADYGVQKTLLMQILFNQVRSLDGYENTRANKDGMVPVLMSQLGFVAVTEHWTVQTPSGSISLWAGRKP